ncbi:MAG: hypothetical protein BWY68_00165 [bacterium ADurb.Bin400]|nr:MAG: hypothetical protein BWY68_00165 [bacterium ADurb.Bin400]
MRWLVWLAVLCTASFVPAGAEELVLWPVAPRPSDSAVLELRPAGETVVIREVREPPSLRNMPPKPEWAIDPEARRQAVEDGKRWLAECRQGDFTHIMELMVACKTYSLTYTELEAEPREVCSYFHRSQLALCRRWLAECRQGNYENAIRLIEERIAFGFSDRQLGAKRGELRLYVDRKLAPPR